MKLLHTMYAARWANIYIDGFLVEGHSVVEADEELGIVFGVTWMKKGAVNIVFDPRAPFKRVGQELIQK